MKNDEVAALRLLERRAGALARALHACGDLPTDVRRALTEVELAKRRIKVARYRAVVIVAERRKVRMP